MNSLTIVQRIAVVVFVCALLIVIVLPYWRIFRKAGFPPWLASLMWIPLVNLIVLYTVAYSDWKTEPMASIQGSADEKIGFGRANLWVFPWRKTFRRLELEKRWWHRLSVVAFFVALIPMYLFSWAIASDSYRPVNPYRQEIVYWAATPQAQNPTAKSHTIYDDIADKEVSALKGGKTIEMPDGMTATYPGTTSDEAIKADWRHKLDAEQAKGWMLGVVMASFVTMCLAYLLQVAYRALLYIIYGSKLKAPLNTFESPMPEVQASQLSNLTE